MNQPQRLIESLGEVSSPLEVKSHLKKLKLVKKGGAFDVIFSGGRCPVATIPPWKDNLSGAGAKKIGWGLTFIRLMGAIEENPVFDHLGVFKTPKEALSSFAQVHLEKLRKA